MLIGGLLGSVISTPWGTFQDFGEAIDILFHRPSEAAHVAPVTCCHRDAQMMSGYTRQLDPLVAIFVFWRRKRIEGCK